MASVIGIYNLALGHLGHGKEVSETNEQSEEASACNRYYEQARDEMLSGHTWSFAKKTASMELVEEDPTTEWAYSYRYPSDCFNLRRILSGVRTDSRQSKISYEMAQDTQGGLVYTDMEDAVCEYTARISDASRFPPLFTKALSYLLASYIAPRITGGDERGKSKETLVLHQLALSAAKAKDSNEGQPDEPPQAEWIGQ